MKKIFSIIALFFSVTAFAQTDIDKINSDNDVLQFFRKEIIGPNTKSNFNDFKLVDGKEWINFYNFNEEEKNELLSKYKYQKWAKTDLNGDRKNDLIVSGYLSKTPGYSQHYRTFIFLTEDGNTFSHVKFNSSVPTYFRLLDSNRMEISRWTNDLYKQEPGLPLRIDTVKFQPELQLLTDAREITPPSSIASIAYTQQFMPKGKITANIIVQPNKNADFIVTEDAQDGKKPPVYNAKVSKDMMKDFLEIAASIPLYEISKEASVVIPDEQMQRTLEISYTDGTKKLFTDGSGNSSYSLSAAYDWIQLSIANLYELMYQRQNISNNYDPFGSW